MRALISPTNYLLSLFEFNDFRLTVLILVFSFATLSFLNMIKYKSSSINVYASLASLALRKLMENGMIQKKMRPFPFKKEEAASPTLKNLLTWRACQRLLPAAGPLPR